MRFRTPTMGQQWTAERPKRPPAISFKEACAEFGLSSGQLRGMLAKEGAPKFALDCSAFFCHNRYYVAADLRAWVKACQEAKQ